MFECCKKSSTGCPRRDLENCSSESNMDYGIQAQDVSETSRLETVIGPRMWLASSPCSKNFLKAKLKISELISLTEEVLRRSNIDSVVWLQPVRALKELRREKRGLIQTGIKGKYEGQDPTQPSL